jgi:ribosomal protein L29
MIKFKKTITNLSSAELQVEVKKVREQLQKAKLDKMGGRLKDLRSTFTLRKKIAILLTKLSTI